MNADIRVVELPSTNVFMPSMDAWFGEPGVLPASPFQIFHKHSLGRHADLLISAHGLFAFDYCDHGPLASIDTYKVTSSGVIPDHVVKREREIHKLQLNRMNFANSVIGLFFAVYAAVTNRDFRDIQFVNLEELKTFRVSPFGIEPFADERFHQLSSDKCLNIVKRQLEWARIGMDETEECLARLQSIMLGGESFEVADLVNCAALSLQSTVAHRQQSATASLSLSLAVIEVLIQEIFAKYGFLNRFEAREELPESAVRIDISGNQFDRMNLKGFIESLKLAKLFDRYVCDELDRLRVLRNESLHKGNTVDPHDSGIAISMLSQIWVKLTGVELRWPASFRYSTV